MLALCFDVGEKLIIRHAGEVCVVKVVERSGRQIKLGIEAPKSWDLNRESIDVLKNGGASCRGHK